MEVKQIIEIFKKQKITFFLVFFAVLVVLAVHNLVELSKFKVVLNLNITRSGIQETSDYRYDGFYRLQADEKFADTIVHWIQSPRVALDVLTSAKLSKNEMTKRKLSKFFKARKLSSQFVKVSFESRNAESAKDISVSVIKVLNQETQKLNEEQGERNWFKIIGGDPVVGKGGWEWPPFIIFSSLVGVFLGFWTVMIKHYLQKSSFIREN